MFDLRTMTLKYEVNLKSGVCLNFLSSAIKITRADGELRFKSHMVFQVCFLEFDRKDTRMNKFVATGLEGMVCLFETRNRKSGFPYISKNVSDYNILISFSTSQLLFYPLYVFFRFIIPLSGVASIFLKTEISSSLVQGLVLCACGNSKRRYSQFIPRINYAGSFMMVLEG